MAIECDSALGKGSGHPVLILLAPLLGWGGYFALMWLWTGNPFEGFVAQRYWGVHSFQNLIDIPKFIIGFFSPIEFHAFKGSLLDRCMFLLLACSIPWIARLGKDFVVWTYVLGILPAMSGTFTSFTRYESTVFPLFIALATYFVKKRSHWPLAGCLTISATLHCVLLWRFVNFRWAG